MSNILSLFECYYDIIKEYRRGEPFEYYTAGVEYPYRKAIKLDGTETPCTFNAIFCSKLLGNRKDTLEQYVQHSSPHALWIQRVEPIPKQWEGVYYRTFADVVYCMINSAKINDQYSFDIYRLHDSRGNPY